MRRICYIRIGLALALATTIAADRQQTDAQMPSSPLKFGVFTARFDSGGTFKMEGDGWPAFTGDWKIKGDEIELSTPGGPKECQGAGRYKLRSDGSHVTFDLVS